MQVTSCSFSRKGLSVLLSGLLAVSLMGTAPAAAYADQGAQVNTGKADAAGQVQKTGGVENSEALRFAKPAVNKTLGSKSFTNKVVGVDSKRETLVWTSSNKKVATVNAKGKVTLRGFGETVIKVKAKNAKTKQVRAAKYTLTVSPQSTKIRKARGAVGGFSVNWKAVSKKMATGYQVRYATTGDMAGARTVTVKGAAKTFALISGLPKGATYFAQVRVYAKAKGKTYYSSWSGVKSVVTGLNSGDEELDAIVETMLATKSIASKKTPEAKLRAVFNRVTKYKYKRDNATPTGEWSVPFAKEMYKNGKGNCYRYAALFCWLARGLGYDAKTVMGGVRLKGNKLAPHGWVEISLDGKTYLCDTELTRELGGIYDLYMITYSNAPVRYKKAKN